MSKLIENKQIIHIVTEVAIIAGVIFLFSSKNKKLLEHIENLSKRLDEQNELIQKHEQIIRQLITVVNNPVSQTHHPNNHKQTSQQKSKSKSLNHLTQQKRKSLSPLKHNQSPQQKLKSLSTSSNRQKSEVSVDDNEKFFEQEKSSDEDDSDLDAEIADELHELQQQDNLKKRI